MNWKNIVLLALSILVVDVSFAQAKKKKITISGYVTDGNDKPLQGVSIIVDRVTLDKQTDEKGFYKIKVKPDIKSIMVYSLNYGGLEIDFTGRTKINFVLAPNQEIEGTFIPADKLVDVGYAISRKNDLSVSAAEIENEKKSSPKYRTIFEMIQGQVPGVTVNGSSVIIRGTGSLRGDTQPLFVLDGVATSSVDMINPSDVKRIDVLKGAAAAIYGTRGSNGVILITTFKGSDKK